MDVNKRGRGDISAGRETVQRAPRSGGRTAAQWAPAEGSEAIVRGMAGRRAERQNAARGRGAATPSTGDDRAADQGVPQRAERLSSLERIERRERAAGTTDTAAEQERAAARAGRQDRAARAERLDRAERAERHDRPERYDRPDRPVRLDRPVRTDRTERLDRPERTDRTERVERFDRAERAERADRADRAVSRNAGGSRKPGTRSSAPRGTQTSRGTQAARGAGPRTPRATSSSAPVDLSAARGLRYATDGSAALEPAEIHVLVEPVEAEPLHVEESPAPRLRVTPPRPVSVPRAPFIAGILVTVVAGVVGILLINTQTNKNAFRLDELQKTQAVLDVQQQELEKQIEEYESPNYLIAHAKKLGLVKSEDPAFITLPDGKVIGVPMPAGGEPALSSQQDGSQQSGGQQSGGQQESGR
jgi:hypothetical protein